MYLLLNDYINAEERNVSLLKQRYKDMESSISSNTLVERIKIASDISELEEKINKAKIKQIIIEAFCGSPVSTESGYSKKEWSVYNVIQLILYIMMLIVMGILIYRLIKGTL